MLQHGGSPLGNSRVKLTNVKDCVKRGLVKEGEDPLKVAAEQYRLCKWLRGHKKLRARGKNIDLEMSIEGRIFENADGKFNFLVECNPLLGPQLMDLAKKVAAGEPVPARVVTPDQTFDQQQAAKVLPDRKY